MKKLEIKTQRLVLTPLNTGFLDSTHEYAGDIDNCRFMCNLPNANKEETQAFLLECEQEWAKKEPEFFEFAVIYENNHIGAVSASIDSEQNCAEIGWIINKKYWRHGFATEAAKALIGYLSADLLVTEFIAHCDSENAPSYRIMEKLGMIRTGEWGGRINRSSNKERREYEYRLTIGKEV